MVATVLLATAVWGRGGGLHPPATSAASAQSATTATADPAPATASTTPTTKGPGLASRVIQWMNEQAPLGGGASGPDEDAYYSLMHGDCARTLALAEGRLEVHQLSGPPRTLYEGAGAACLAAFEHRPRLWPRAEAAMARYARQAGVPGCEDRAVYELLQRLVLAHRADPSARLVKRVAGRRALVCPRFTSITPSHGPAEGGYTVRLEGEHLPEVVGVHFGDRRMKVPVRAGRQVVITVPPATELDLIVGGVWVEPDGARILQLGDGVTFRYDPPAATTRSSTSSSRPPTSTSTSEPATSTSTTAPAPASS